ncbi:MAG: putative Ig domain-containing protein [Pseudomonadota bacterium]
MAVQRYTRWNRTALVVALATTILGGCLEEQEDDAADLVGAATSPTPGPGNRAPVISGSPPQTITIGEQFLFQPTVTDPDNDTLAFSITNKPDWASFNAETGVLSGLPSSNDVGAYGNMSIFVTDGVTSRGIGPFNITVQGDNNRTNTPPTISGTPPRTVDAGSVYSFTPSAADADNDALRFSVVNPPSWARFDSTTGRLSGTPENRHAGTFAGIRISVTDGTDAARLERFTITVVGVTPPNSPPTISGAPPSSVTVGTPYLFQPSANDADGDALRFSVVNPPRWASFDTSTGRLSGVPSAAEAGTTANIVIQVSDGTAVASLGPFAITAVERPNAAPTISGSPPTAATVGTAYSFQPSASDADNDALTFSIANRPSWASFNASTGRLAGTPGDSNVGTSRNIRISVSDGKDTSALPAFSITVDAAPNEAPTITGTPARTATVGEVYQFRPVATDADNDSLSFSISNQPNWAAFDRSTGALTGTPGDGDVGVFRNIEISVSDGTDTATLPAFAITVEAAPNTAPTISGTPPTEAMVDVAYVFQPGANDADNDTLTFSIRNAPAWLSIDPASGQVSGTPSTANVGSYAGIVVSVSDGTDSASLPGFTLTVVESASGSITLTWDAPTERTDGSALTDLTGYRIYYGTQSGSYTETIELMDPGLTVYVVSDLVPGTYFISAKAVSASGGESGFAAEITREVATN